MLRNCTEIVDIIFLHFQQSCSKFLEKNKANEIPKEVNLLTNWIFQHFIQNLFAPVLKATQILNLAFIFNKWI